MITKYNQAQRDEKLKRVDKIKALLAKGYSQSEVARKLLISHTRVWQLLNDYKGAK